MDALQKQDVPYGNDCGARGGPGVRVLELGSRPLLLPRCPMSEQEQPQALADAGFANVNVELSTNGLLLYAGGKVA